MKVSELITLLQGMPPGAEVVITPDVEIGDDIRYNRDLPVAEVSIEEGVVRVASPSLGW